ncbi:putative acetyltransferase [Virgibacillus halotolerans]|uniref:GNAT family N-acetyltransferase n=1 Tax=Virgibacillus halotolerans TaxID=1071053 RepID=UPI00195F66B2|nr:GNAT family N-acetyltransferase [Virgibacillus halotolerans]MBM7601828.1 putative acetyltransferase [Virgibacillus halotolerans]
MKQIKRLNETNYTDIFALSQFAFQYELSEAELLKKRAEAARHKIWGWMVDDQIAAKLHLIPLSIYLNGRQFEMGGISSVATWPEYRRQGMVKHLLKHALNDMKEQGQTISLLHPFSVPFYRQYGWELTFMNQYYTIPMEKLKKDWKGEGFIKRIKPDVTLLDEIYIDYAKGFTGMIVRDEKWWEQRVLKDKCHIAVAFNKEQQPEGYMLYEVKENIFRVKEMAHRNLNGRKLLLQFIANHDSMAKEARMTVPENDNLPLLVDDPVFAQKKEPYFMARIVDVGRFLENYLFELESDVLLEPLQLYVEDEFFPINNGTYKLEKVAGDIKVLYMKEQENGIRCSVQQLTVMLLGYKRPMDLFQVGLIRGEKQEVELLEKLIPKQQTFLSDFY